MGWRPGLKNQQFCPSQRRQAAMRVPCGILNSPVCLKFFRIKGHRRTFPTSKNFQPRQSPSELCQTFQKERILHKLPQTLQRGGTPPAGRRCTARLRNTSRDEVRPQLPASAHPPRAHPGQTKGAPEGSVQPPTSLRLRWSPDGAAHLDVPMPG